MIHHCLHTGSGHPWLTAGCQMLAQPHLRRLARHCQCRKRASMSGRSSSGTWPSTPRMRSARMLAVSELAGPPCTLGTWRPCTEAEGTEAAAAMAWARAATVGWSNTAVGVRVHPKAVLIEVRRSIAAKESSPACRPMRLSLYQNQNPSYSSRRDVMSKLGADSKLGGDACLH